MKHLFFALIISVLTIQAQAKVSYCDMVDFEGSENSLAADFPDHLEILEYNKKKIVIKFAEEVVSYPFKEKSLGKDAAYLYSVYGGPYNPNGGTISVSLNQAGKVAFYHAYCSGGYTGGCSDYGRITYMCKM